MLCELGGTAEARGIEADFTLALAAKDSQRLRSMLAEDIDFRGLTLGRFWEAHTAEDLIENILRQWFEDSDEIEDLVACTTSRVGDRNLVSYQLEVRNPDGTFLVEQQMYFDIDDEQIAFARSLCSGYQQVEAPISRAEIAPRVPPMSEGWDSLKAELAMLLSVVRLTAPLEEIKRRLSAEVTTGRQEDLRGTIAQVASREGEGIEVLVVANDRSIRQVAMEVLDRVGWS